jgi:hypothetical protein
MIVRFMFVILLMMMPDASALAQRVLIGQGVDSLGRLDVTRPKWVIGKDKPIYLDVLYRSDSLLTMPKGYIFVDRKGHLGHFEEYRTVKVWQRGQKWAGAPVLFDDAGDYRVCYANAQKKVLACDTAKVRFDQEVFFCQELGKGGVPVGISHEFWATETGLVHFYLYIQSERPFDTHKLITKTYEYKVGDYRKPISEVSDYVRPEWKQVAFRGPIFTKPGQYRVQVFKANGEPFATAFLTIHAFGEASSAAITE